MAIQRNRGGIPLAERGGVGVRGACGVSNSIQLGQRDRRQSSELLGWGNLGACGDQWEQTAPVGSFTPNAWGLHDMHGNVWEWMEDGWNASYVGAPSDGSAWLGGDSRERVLRGGSWGSDPDSLRTSSRYWSHPNYDSAHVGFRVARSDIGFAWPM